MRLHPSVSPAKLFVLENKPAAEENQTGPMTWKVNWIAKREAQKG